MEITKVKLIKVNKDYGHVKAIGHIIIDNAICISGIKVVETKEKRFVSMPSRREDDGIYKDIAYPINQEARNQIEEEIMKEYRRLENNAEYQY